MDFDMCCLWIGRIAVIGTVCFVLLSIVALLVFRVVERVFGKDEMERKAKVAEDLVRVLVWHQGRMDRELERVGTGEDKDES